jgi:hypothetical protein
MLLLEAEAAWDRFRDEAFENWLKQQQREEPPA